MNGFVNHDGGKWTTETRIGWIECSLTNLDPMPQPVPRIYQPAPVLLFGNVNQRRSLEVIEKRVCILLAAIALQGFLRFLDSVLDLSLLVRWKIPVRRKTIWIKEDERVS
jgi:hypothetical protein